MKKVLVCILLSGLCLSASASGAVQPLIPFDGVLGDESKMIFGTGGGEGEPVNQGIVSYSTFERELTQKIKTVRKKYDFKRPDLIANRNIQESTYEGQYILSVVLEIMYRSGIYIGDSQGKIHSYCLLSPMHMERLMSEPFVQKVLALPQNPHYLQGKLPNPNPSKMSLIFYEYQHPQHIERYGILSYYAPSSQEMHHILVLDAFYPKSFENYLEPQILLGLENIMGNFYIHSLTKTELERFIEQQQSN